MPPPRAPPPPPPARPPAGAPGGRAARAGLERAVDQAALELGIDPIELRKKNLLHDDVFPFTTLTGVTYDTGAYTTPLDTAARAAGYDDLRREQAERRARGDRKLLGIGVAAYVEVTAGGGASEFGAVEIDGADVFDRARQHRAHDGEHLFVDRAEGDRSPALGDEYPDEFATRHRRHHDAALDAGDARDGHLMTCLLYTSRRG